MFNWLRKKFTTKPIFHDWQLDELSGFERIVNKGSIQYHSEQAKRTIYFSALTIHGASSPELREQGLLTGSATTHKEGGQWHLKGTKGHGSQLLVCVISLTYKEDLEWAHTFFNSIRHKEEAPLQP